MSRQVSFAPVGEKVEFGAHPAMAASTAAIASQQQQQQQQMMAPAPAAAGFGGFPAFGGVPGGLGLPLQQQAPVREALPGGATLSCNTCRESFKSVEELRKHFDSELHLRNIRARVEGQPTMDRAEFRRQFGAAGADPDGVGSIAPAPIFTCNLCKRTYKSAQTLQSHLKSTEHLMRKEQRILQRQSDAGSVLSSTSLGSAAMGLHRRHKAHTKNLTRKMAPGLSANGDADGAAAALAAMPVVENVIDEDGEVVQRVVPSAADRPKVSAEERETDVTPARCFFCGFKSSSIKANLKHMCDHHEFTLPLEDRVKDLVGLMEYLCKKINACLCLVCAEHTKRYDSLEALRGHMRTAGHERVVLGPEYQEFFGDGDKLDDGSEAKLNRAVDEKTGQVVIKTSSGASLLSREAELGGVVRHQRESATQKEERRMLTASKMEENALMIQERRELQAPAVRQEEKMARDRARRDQQMGLKVAMKTGKSHMKGFDGEGETN